MSTNLYESPNIEVLEIEIENAVLTASGENSDIVNGW
jgi:hypothetical protein